MLPTAVLLALLSWWQICSGFIIRNQLDFKIKVAKVNRHWSSYMEYVNPGSERACTPLNDGCHDTGKDEKGKDRNPEEIHLEWYRTSGASRPANPFNGPRNALFRFTYIDANNKPRGVKISVFREEKELDSHLHGTFEFTL